MRTALLFAVSLSACDAGSVKLLFDSSAADTGANDTADTGETADTGATADTVAHSYAGTVAGAADLTNSVGLVTCTGPFSLAWGADLQVAGEARCEGDAGAFSGAISGAIAGTKLMGVFVYTGYGVTGDADVDATVLSGALNGTISDQDSGIALSLELTGTGG